jgi:hypothetical protein
MYVDAGRAARGCVEGDALEGQCGNHGDPVGAWQLFSCGAPELGRHHETSVAAP